MNPEYKKIPCVPIEISMRDDVGKSLNLDELDTIDVVVKELLANTDAYKEKITEVLNHYMYDIGHANESGSEYIIARIKEIEYLRKKQQI